MNRLAASKTRLAPTAESERLIIRPAAQAPAYSYHCIVEEKASGQVVLELNGKPGYAEGQTPLCIQPRVAYVQTGAMMEAIALINQAENPSPDLTSQNRAGFFPLSRQQVIAVCQQQQLPAACVPEHVTHPEACRLRYGGRDCFGRPFYLHPDALTAWLAMQKAAAGEGVFLAVVSAFRSYAYQASLIRKKLAAGHSLEHILQVNAMPGCSEHHTGQALDLHCPHEPDAPEVLETTFENTRAFSWLRQHAADFGFYLSYPRNNTAGFIYEPWHWHFDLNKT